MTPDQLAALDDMPIGCDVIPQRRRHERRGAGMPAQEIADLSIEAGRDLNEAQAHAFRMRKLAWDGVERRMNDRRNASPDSQFILGRK